METRLIPVGRKRGFVWRHLDARAELRRRKTFVFALRVCYLVDVPTGNGMMTLARVQVAHTFFSTGGQGKGSI